MRIAVTMRSVICEMSGETRDCISRDVVTWLEKLGVQPILVPNGLRDAVGFVRSARADGLLLAGGNDLGADPVRDAMEESLLQAATASQLPVLGICRGMQMIARHFGARAIESIGPAKAHVGTHELVLRHPALQALGASVDGAQSMATNSFHDFGVREHALSRELDVMAVSSDGFVEALKHRDLPIIAVQWHPERAGSCAALDAPLLDAWLAYCGASTHGAASARAGARV